MLGKTLIAMIDEIPTRSRPRQLASSSMFDSWQTRDSGDVQPTQLDVSSICRRKTNVEYSLTLSQSATYERAANYARVNGPRGGDRSWGPLEHEKWPAETGRPCT
jgi:hypothetical protein